MGRYFNNKSPLKVISNDLKYDSIGTIAFSIRYFFIIIRFIFWSLLKKIHLICINVKFGKNNKFIGWSIISRYPKSQIIIGDNCVFNSAKNVNLIGVNRKCIISTQSREAILKIGNNCGFSGTTISAFKKVTIGNNIKFGANVLITDSDWHPDDFRSGEDKPVIIEDNVWLGINSVVLKGVRIGKNSLIGANSVVTKNIPPNSIAAGNPCVTLKSIIK